MSGTATTNRFGLFTAAMPTTKKATPPNRQIDEIDRFVKARHQHLLEHADVLTKARLLRSYHRVKPFNDTRQYLLRFIEDFSHDPVLRETVNIYRKKLATYQKAQTPTPTHSPSVTYKNKKELLKLTQEQQAWQQLMETLKRCVNTRTTRQLAWHPHHLEHYYFAKARILWQDYLIKYGDIAPANLPEKLTQEIIEERQQTVIEKHVEAQHNLLHNKMEPSPAYSDQQQNLKAEKAKNLEEINALTPDFMMHANAIIAFVTCQPNLEVQTVFNKALTESQRLERAVTTQSPTLFNLPISHPKGGQHKHHELATLEKIDTSSDMQTYSKIFSDESSKILEALENSATAPRM